MKQFAPFVLIATLILVACGESPSPTATAVPAVTVLVVTATQPPATNTTVPTNTPTPTTTPTPTSVPTLTPAPTMQDSAGVYAYTSKISSIMTDVAEASGKIGTLSAMLSEDITMLNNSVWRKAIAIQLVRLTINAGSIRKLTPPLSMADIHVLTLKIADHLDSSAEHYAKGVDGIDMSEFLLASKDMDAIASLANQATALIRKMVPIDK